MKILVLQISNRAQTLQFITMPLHFLGRTIEYNIRIKDRYKDFYELISPSILWIYYFTQRSKRQKYNTIFNRNRKRTSGWRSERVSAQETVNASSWLTPTAGGESKRDGYRWAGSYHHSVAVVTTARQCSSHAHACTHTQPPCGNGSDRTKPVCFLRCVVSSAMLREFS